MTLTEFEFGEFGVDDPLREIYEADPVAVTQAVAQQAAQAEAARAVEAITTHQQQVATQKNAQLAAVEVERDLLERIPDFNDYRAEVAARVAADPAMFDDLVTDPARVARRIEDVYKVVKVEAEQKSDEESWFHVRKASVESSAYWDPRRRLLDVPRSEGGFKE